MKHAVANARCPQCHALVPVKASKLNSAGRYKEILHCPECGYRRTKMVKPIAFASIRKANMHNLNQKISSKATAKDLLQPFDGKGKLSYDFLATYGDKALGPKAKEQAKQQFG